MRTDMKLSLSKPLEEMKPHYDVVIIGSGYGGGVAASRLSRAGLSVCVLERGKEIKPGEFKTGALANVQAAQINGRKIQIGDPTNLYDFRLGQDLHVILACGLGGGSLINSALALRPDLEGLKRRGWPDELFQGEELEQGFARAEDMLGVNPCPTPYQFSKFKALDQGAKQLGLRAEPKNTAIHYQDGINRANVAQSACTLCGGCWMGCNSGAKNTVTVTYLTDAFDHGADIFTSLKVRSLEQTDPQDETCPWRVNFMVNKARRLREKLRLPTVGKNSSKLCPPLSSVSANIVILAAGSLGSTEILLRSRENGLLLSEQLGQNFSANCDDINLGVNQAGKVNGNAHSQDLDKAASKIDLEPVGPGCMGYIRYDKGPFKDKPLLIEDGVMVPIMSKLAPMKALLAGKPKRAIKMLRDGPYKGLRTHIQTYYLVTHDSSDGQLVLNNDKLEVEWPHIHDQDIYQDMKDILMKMVEGLGGEYKENPLSEMSGRKVTAHPLGGCGMGDSDLTGVVNHKCQIFKPSSTEGQGSSTVYQGLYVCDGSIMPTSIGSNPLLTITAMAERAMVLLAKDHNLTFDDKPKQDAPLRQAVG